jgi:hypothetical protein
MMIQPRSPVLERNGGNDPTAPTCGDGGAPSLDGPSITAAIAHSGEIIRYVPFFSGEIIRYVPFFCPCRFTLRDLLLDRRLGCRRIRSYRLGVWIR